MSKGDADPNSEAVPIVVEAYGFKVSTSSRPDELGERPPTSWRDVPGQVNQDLMRIAVAPTRLIADVLEGATRLIRGIARIPSAVARRVERAHVEADADERVRQEAALDAMRRRPPSDAPRAQLMAETPNEDKAAAAVNEIQSVLRKYIAKGRDAYIILGPEGKPIIVFGTPPGSEPQVRAAIKEAQGLLNDSIEEDR